MKVALVQFKKTGKKYYFGLGKTPVESGDKVVVETIRGIEVGVVSGFKEIDPKDLVAELKDIERLATEKDLLKHEENLAEIPEILETTKDLVESHNLEMRILDAEYTLDKSRLLVYFEADDRIDFRELVKDLSSVYRTRIELRQIGSRDGAKLVGGIGPCGLILCCNTFIGDFDTITIKMAKNQNISLNPVKISGACDKLLCCIKYENEAYTYLKEKMPEVGSEIEYQGQIYKVQKINLLKEKIQIESTDEGMLVWLKASEIKKVG